MRPNSQSGQTLIETIVAIFILTTALTAGLGLAIYAMSVGSTAQNQIVAASLAREGVEVVRMMRDSNWLASDVKGGAWDLTTCNDIGGRLCYPKAYEQVPPYNGYDLSTGFHQVNFDSLTATWTITGTPSYNLYLQNDGIYTHTNNNTPSIYARQIYLTKNGDAPFTYQNSNQELIVFVAVAWRGKNCTDFSTSQDLISDNNFRTPCRIIIEERLTNWKDYR